MRCFPSGARYLLSVLFSLLLAASLSSREASAATVVPLTLEEMNEKASEVFVGTVLSTKAGWDKDKRLIETRVMIRVDQRVKGAGRPTATVVVPGGIVGDIGMHRPGAAAFREGERILLLAEPKRGTDLRPVGLFQGKLRVRHDDALGVDVVEAPGPAWGSQGERLAPGKKPKGRIPPLPLSDVLDRLGAGP